VAVWLRKRRRDTARTGAGIASEKAGPIFLMNVESIEQAKAELDTALPLVAADLMTYVLIRFRLRSPQRLPASGGEAGY
jgi:hypothetical protein